MAWKKLHLRLEHTISGDGEKSQRLLKNFHILQSLV